MRKDLIRLLICPSCRHELIISRVLELLIIDGNEFVKTGLLSCGNCGDAFPVIDRIPRILRHEQLNQTEKNLLTHFACVPPGEPQISFYEELNDHDKYRIIYERITNLLKPERAVTEKHRRRILHDINYRVYETENKNKLINTSLEYMDSVPRVLLEVGSGQGGALSCFRKFFIPEHCIAIDLNEELCQINSLRDPLLNVIRANATNLPLSQQAVDLCITTSVLEHIREYKSFLDEICRTSKNALIGYGPNGWFFYDWGHTQGVIFPLLSKKHLAQISHLLHILKKSGRSFDSIYREMLNTYYIPRIAVTKHLQKYGTVLNAFATFMYYSVNSNYHYIGAKYKNFFKRHPHLLTALCHLVMAVGMEPMVYLFFRRSS